MAGPTTSRNVRTALVLVTVALAFFFAVILKYMVLK